MKKKRVNKLLRYFLLGLIVAILTCSIILPTTSAGAVQNYGTLDFNNVANEDNLSIIELNGSVPIQTNSFTVPQVGNQNPANANAYVRTNLSNQPRCFILTTTGDSSSRSAIYGRFSSELQWVSTYTFTIKYSAESTDPTVPLFFKLYRPTNAVDVNLNNAELVDSSNGIITRRFTVPVLYDTYTSFWLYWYAPQNSIIEFYSLEFSNANFNLTDYELGYQQGVIDGSTSVQDTLELGIFKGATADITVQYNFTESVTFNNAIPDTYYNAIGFTSYVNEDTNGSFFRMDIKLNFKYPWLFSQYPIFLSSDKSIGQTATFITDTGERYVATTSTEFNYENRFIPVEGQESLNNSIIVAMEFSFYQQSGYARYLNSYSGATLDSYNKGLQAGKDLGYNLGYKAGEISGLQRGEINGFNKGYNQGRIDATDFSFFGLISAVIEVPINAITSLFNFEVFGYNLTNFVLFLFTLCVILAVLRLIF